MYDNPLVYISFLCQHCWEQKSIFWKICLHICFSSFTSTVNHVSSCGICHEVYIPYAIDRYNMMGEYNKIKTKSQFSLSLSGVLMVFMLGSKRNPCLLSIYYMPGIAIFVLSYLILPITLWGRFHYLPYLYITQQRIWEGQVTSPRTNS